MAIRNPASRIQAGFTLIELLVVITIIVLLLAILGPSLGRAISLTEQTACASNMRQVQIAFNAYLAEHFGTFPAHRDFGYDKFLPTEWQIPGANDDFWGAAIYPYVPSIDIMKCPSLQGKQTNYGHTWEWAYNRHHVGYGYNAYFLGVWSHNVNIDRTGALRSWMSTTQWLNIAQVKNPSMNLLTGDSNPIPFTSAWSSTLWWPKAGGPYYEGVNPDRHDGIAAVSFNDGHAELVTHEQINPHTAPKDTGDDTNVKLWDPQQRDNPSF